MTKMREIEERIFFFGSTKKVCQAMGTRYQVISMSGGRKKKNRFLFIELAFVFLS